jgi:histone H3/H4
MRNQQQKAKTSKQSDEIQKKLDELQKMVSNSGKVSGKTTTKKKKTSDSTKKVEVGTKRKRSEETTEAGENEKAKVRKKRRFKPGTKALMEIRNQQKNAHLKGAIPKKSFENLVREILQDQSVNSNGKYRIGKEAVKLLQEISEGYLVQALSLGNTLDIEIGKRSGITRKSLLAANTMLSPQKQYLLNNTVRGTDLMGEYTMAFPKEDAEKKRKYTKKKALKPKAPADTKDPEPSVEKTLNKEGDDPVETEKGEEVEGEPKKGDVPEKPMSEPHTA